MGKCSICQGTGHNCRTCPHRPGTALTTTIISEKVVMGVNTTPRKSNFFTSASTKDGMTTPTRKPGIIPIALKPPLTNQQNNKGNNDPRNQSKNTHSSRIPEVIYPPQFNPAQKIDVTRLREKVIKEKDSDLIKKIEKLPIPKTPMVQTTSNFCNGCHNQEHLLEKCPSSTPTLRNDRYDKKCRQCGQFGHNFKTCPQLEEKRKEEKALKSKLASWLNSSSRDRFTKGPTATDGTGYIYIYTYDKPKCEGDKNLFKIGMSKNEEGKRRIEVQEARNKEHYRVLYHEETPFRWVLV